MTINYSSRISTRGLIFNVDAGNSASLATNIRRNLVAEGPRENLANWNFLQGVTVQTNTTTAPDGTLTADTAFDNNVNGTHSLQLLATVPSSAASETLTFSIYAKAGTINTFTLIGFGPTTQPARHFNLSTGTSIGSILGSGAPLFSIVPVGDGWYRCSITGQISAPSAQLIIYLFPNDNSSFSYVGGSGSISFWGAQLEVGSTATQYYPISTPSSQLNTRWYDTTGTSRPIPFCQDLSTIEVLVVGGGGGGGPDVGGGGGGGGVVYNPAYPVRTSTAYTVTVGAGGNAGSGPTPSIILGGNGGNSQFDNITAIGGGAGGSYAAIRGSSGGSGGGSSGDSTGTFLVAGNGTGNQGFFGGIGTINSVPYGAGGGGGAGGPGGNFTAAGGGNGGPGVLYSISGTPTYYGSGGAGGGGNDSSSDGRGFPTTPGGGIGSARSGPFITVLRDGTANTGGGGGGTGGWNTAGAGGSGVVIVRYPGPARATGGIITSVNGFTIHTFTSGSSTFTLNQIPTGYVNQNFGTFQNNVTYDPRNSGALVFDNTTSYVALPELPAQVNAPLSVFSWVYLNATPTGTNGIWGHYGTGNCHYEINPTATRLRLGDINKTDLPMLAVGSWQYVGFTSDGTNHSYYVNGVLSTSWTGTTGTILGGNATTLPSSHMVGRSDAGRTWNGRIANLTINNVQLTAAEVLNNYNALRGRYGV